MSALWCLAVSAMLRDAPPKAVGKPGPLQHFNINNYVSAGLVDFPVPEPAHPVVEADGHVVDLAADDVHLIAPPEFDGFPAAAIAAVPIPAGAPPVDVAQLAALLEATRNAANEATRARHDAALILTECERQVAISEWAAAKASNIRQSVQGYGGLAAKAANAAAKSATDAQVALQSARDHAQHSANSATTSTIAMTGVVAAAKTCSAVSDGSRLDAYRVLTATT